MRYDLNINEHYSANRWHGINILSMKEENKNKDYTEEIHEDDNLTEEQEVLNQEDNLDDNMTDEDELLSDEEVDEEKTLEEKYNELNDSYLRLHAEYDNYRRRTVKEKMEIIKTGGEKVLAEMIPLIDDFERALETAKTSDDKDALIEGLELIYSKFVGFINRHGVKEIEAIGEPFDADKFEAVTTIPVQDESQEGIVVDCVQKGYILNEKVIRFPKVIVGK